jgi:hypothetical protein
MRRFVGARRSLVMYDGSALNSRALLLRVSRLFLMFLDGMIKPRKHWLHMVVCSYETFLIRILRGYSTQHVLLHGYRRVTITV